MPVPIALYVLDTVNYPKICGPEGQRDIAAVVRLAGPAQTRESVAKDPALLGEVGILLSGRGAPRQWEVTRERAGTLA